MDECWDFTLNAFLCVSYSPHTCQGRIRSPFTQCDKSLLLTHILLCKVSEHLTHNLLGLARACLCVAILFLYNIKWYTCLEESWSKIFCIRAFLSDLLDCLPGCRLKRLIVWMLAVHSTRALAVNTAIWLRLVESSFDSS